MKWLGSPTEVWRFLGGRDQDISESYAFFSLNSDIPSSRLEDSPALVMVFATVGTLVVLLSTLVEGQAQQLGCMTYYDPLIGQGTCGFDLPNIKYPINPAPPFRYTVALNVGQFASAALCGACVRITGPTGAKVVARITDQCPGCGRGDLDVSPEVFAKLAAEEVGKVQIQWEVVACDRISVDGIDLAPGTASALFEDSVPNRSFPYSYGGLQNAATSFAMRPLSSMSQHSDIRYLVTAGSTIDWLELRVAFPPAPIRGLKIRLVRGQPFVPMSRNAANGWTMTGGGLPELPNTFDLTIEYFDGSEEIQTGIPCNKDRQGTYVTSSSSSASIRSPRHLISRASSSSAIPVDSIPELAPFFNASSQGKCSASAGANFVPPPMGFVSSASSSPQWVIWTRWNSWGIAFTVLVLNFSTPLW
ncbi:hypothetical protein DFS34DRAFT_607287 [Phlyctochytrium arcticum]|nr:hypothetical protein DFS34DRAFT_607287 [Phlyctochytrium arcticum]